MENKFDSSNDDDNSKRRPFGNRENVSSSNRPYQNQRSNYSNNNSRPSSNRNNGGSGERSNNPSYSSDRPRKPYNNNNRENQPERNYNNPYTPNSEKPFYAERPYQNNRSSSSYNRPNDGKPGGYSGGNRERIYNKPNGERPPYQGGSKPPYGNRPQRNSEEGNSFENRPNRNSYSRDGQRPYQSKGPRPPYNADRPQRENSENSHRKGSPANRGFARDARKGNDYGKMFKPKPKKTARPFTEHNGIAPDYDNSRFKEYENKNKAAQPNESGEVRLNRYLANAGICSRRDADMLIQQGEVSINGSIITELGYKVKRGDEVRYSGRLLSREKKVYVLLNKPKDFITTTNDPMERKTVMQLVSNACKERIYPIGRLDRNTTGLLVVTNDGELSQKLAHPSSKIRKIYEVKLTTNISEDDFQKLQEGVTLFDGFIKPDEVAIVGDKSLIGIEIHSGKNRIVRRIFEHLGYEVERLDRVMYANLTKKDLPRGHWRFLTEKEIISLKYFS